MSDILLRELTNDDINGYYLDGFKNDDVIKFLEVDGRNLTKQKVIDYIEHGKKTKSYYMYAICLKDNNKQIGNLKIGPINKNHMLSDLVTVIWDKSQWGKGLATVAIKLGNKIAFEKYNIRKLTGGMISDNIGSIKAYTKAGWFIEGKLQNHYIIEGKLKDRVIVSCFNPSFEK